MNQSRITTHSNLQLLWLRQPSWGGLDLLEKTNSQKRLNVVELNHDNYSWIIKKSSWGFPLNVRDPTINASLDAFPEISSKISFDSELLKNILRHHNKWKPKYLDRKTLILFSFSISFFWRYTYHPLNVNGFIRAGFWKDFGALSFWKLLVFTMGVSI